MPATTKPIDLLVVRQYEKYGIKVLVRIDRREKTATLVEWDGTKYRAKNWMFGNRELEYMNGWVAIFRAMEFAITEARKELQKFAKEETDELLNLYVALNEIKLEEEK